jgi:hypothetical protein
MQESEQRHNLDNTVIAVLDPDSETGDAVTDLTDAGFRYEVLRGESGREHLDPGDRHDGLMATVRRLVEHFGDEYQVLDRLDDALAAGKLVVSVDTRPENANRAVDILRRHGGHYLWRFGEWTFTDVGD